MDLCINCQQCTNKYKCPKCLEPYCSLNCWNAHKQSDCVKKTPEIPRTAKNVAAANDVEEPTIHFPFPTEDTVPYEKLEQLRHAVGLHKLLENPYLRDLVKEIDVAPNAWKAICAAMQEPLFIEFADECLKVVEPSNDKDAKT